MVSNTKEAKDLCETFGVNSSEYPQIVVTANGNIYLDGNIDPKDTSERFNPNEKEAKEPVKKKQS